MNNFDDLIKLLDEIEVEDMDQRNAKSKKENRWRIIPRDAAEFLSILARSVHAKNIVEIGTSVAYSTIWLAMVARSLGGKVTTFEIDPKKIEIARSHLDKSGLNDFVEIINANPINNRDKIPNNIDLIFLDAEKEDYVPHFNAIYDKLKDGGVVVADNIVSHFRELKGYIELVRNHNNCNSVMISSIGKGFELTYKFISGESEKNPWNQIVR
ncbi:MAG: DUF1442 domain-containing protein [Candidatus Heimdallarchaeota archaeon]|nr:DUF1442 domain-containing protein [Candidatus Heimdallarchaeota archaeon]